MSPARRRGRLVALLLGLAVFGGIGAGVLAHAITGGIGAGGVTLPALHGQATWSPGEKPAPRFALRDQDGAFVSLAQLLGRPVLLTFFDSHCDEQCPIAGHQLGHVLSEMPADTRPAVIVVSVNPRGDTPQSIRHAMAHWHLDGPWRWHWLRGTQRQLERVWKDYGITVEPVTNDITHGLALYLIDRQGFQRSGYLFPFLPNFVALDLEKLARQEA